GISASLEEVQQLREFALLLAVRARVEMAEGKFDRVATTLRTGLAVARHAGEAPTVIGSLISVALASVALKQLDDFIQWDGAPNLYWALTDLPRPFVALRKALQGERITIYGVFPGFGEAAGDLNMGPLEPEQLRACVDSLIKEEGGVDGFIQRTGLAWALV